MQNYTLTQRFFDESREHFEVQVVIEVQCFPILTQIREGCRPGSSQYEVKLQLPFSCTYESIYHQYEQNCLNKSVQPVRISKFRALWDVIPPELFRLSKQSGMCTLCGRFSN